MQVYEQLLRSAGATLLRNRSRWVAVDWSELPGWNADTTPAAWGLQVALMTQPTNSPNFGWNLEAGYASFNEDATGSDSVTGFELSTELLFVF